MYCGYYGEVDGRRDDSFFYIGINLHWKAHYLGLPQLPKGKEWILYASTDSSEVTVQGTEKAPAVNTEDSVERKLEIYVAPRTIAVYTVRDCPIISPKDRKKEI